MIIGLVDRDEMPGNLHREAFRLGVGVVGEIGKEGFTGLQVVLLCGQEGSERAVNAGRGFVNDGGADSADWGSEGG